MRIILNDKNNEINIKSIGYIIQESVDFHTNSGFELVDEYFYPKRITLTAWRDKENNRLCIATDESPKMYHGGVITFIDKEEQTCK